MSSIPVGRQAHASAARTVELTCRRCGFAGAAQVTGVGVGVQSFVNPPGTAIERARRDAEADIDRTLRRARCPKCRLRNPGAAFDFWWPWAAGRVAAMALRVMPLIFAVSLLLVVPLAAFTRWSTTDGRVQWK